MHFHAVLGLSRKAPPQSTRQVLRTRKTQALYHTPTQSLSDYSCGTLTQQSTRKQYVPNAEDCSHAPRKAATPSTKDALLDEFQALVGDTEKLQQHSASLAGEQAEALREDIRSSLSRARETLHNAESGLREQGKMAVDATEDYVHKHPWQALGLSAAIGLVLGLLISRR